MAEKHDPRFLVLPKKSAFKVETHVCCACPDLHLVLFDKKGKAFAQAVLSTKFVDELHEFVHKKPS